MAIGDHPGNPQAPSYAFADALSPADCKRYLALPFDVPPGTRELTIDLAWEQGLGPLPGGVTSLLAIGLYDPEGFRGNQHSGLNPITVRIGPPATTTPGFRPGPLAAGHWTLELQTHMVLPGAPLNYRAEVRLFAGPPAEPLPRTFPQQPPLRTGPGWYRGDLHAHTLHSDGQDTVASLLARAHADGLDFVALTDHNAIEGLYDPVLWGYRGLAVIPGLELTTYYGHALALGVSRWFDWRTGGGRRRTMGQILEEVHAEGGLSVLAHLAAFGDPACTGCAWLYTDQMPGQMRAMEVWNGSWFQMGNNNPTNLRIYYEWLSQGWRLPCLAGSDTHGPQEDWKLSALNVVYARELSAEAILEGAAAGHVMLSSGPALYLQAVLADGRAALMGDQVKAGEVLSLEVRTPEAPAGARAVWIVDGEAAASWPAEAGVASPTFPAGARWVLAELRAADGELLALTNPLYLI